MSVPSMPLHAVIVAGPNGSGKSALIQQLQKDATFAFPERYINADAIARELTNGTQQEKEKAAFREARELRRIYRQQGVSHAFETVLSHPSGLLDLIKLRNAGFEITFVFVTTSDPKINIGRIKRRVQMGGHDVPTDKITERYERTLSFLPRSVEIVDYAYIFDSTQRTRLAAMTENGALISEISSLPLYLVERLATPLTERRSARERLQAVHGGGKPDTPNEESGVYEGKILAAETHYILQESNTIRPLLHDALLLKTQNIKSAVGKIRRISYKDGYGFLTE